MMDLVVAVAIGVLSLIFVGSLIALLIICRHKCGRIRGDRKPILKYTRDQSDFPGGIENGGLSANSAGSETELDDVMQLSPSIGRCCKSNQLQNMNIFDKKT